MLVATAAVIAGCGDTASDSKAPATKKVSANAKKTEAAKEKPKTDTEQLEHLLFERGWALESLHVRVHDPPWASSTGPRAPPPRSSVLI